IGAAIYDDGCGDASTMAVIETSAEERTSGCSQGINGHSSTQRKTTFIVKTSRDIKTVGTALRYPPFGECLAAEDAADAFLALALAISYINQIRTRQQWNVCRVFEWKVQIFSVHDWSVASLGLDFISLWGVQPGDEQFSGLRVFSAIDDSGVPVGCPVATLDRVGDLNWRTITGQGQVVAHCAHQADISAALYYGVVALSGA